MYVHQPGRARTFTLLAAAVVVTATLLVPLGPAAANHPAGTCLDVRDEAVSAEKGFWGVVRPELMTQAGGACGPSPAVAGSAGVNVDFEVTGPNDPDGGNTPGTPDATCTIGPGESTCAMSFDVPSAGTDTVRAWFDHDGSDATPDGDLAEPAGPDDGDSTDVVTRTSEVRVPARLDCDLRDATGPAADERTTPITGPRASDYFVCAITTAGGEPVWTQHPVWAEVLGPTNDPDDPDAVSYTSPDYACDRNGAETGKCLLLFGLESPNGEYGTRGVDAEYGTSEVCVWVGAASEGASLCGAEPWDEGAAADGSDTGNDLADTVRRTWEAPAAEKGGLDAEPEKYAAGTGSYYAPHVEVFDQFGSPLFGATPVKLELFSGSPGDTDGNTPATPDFACTTNGSTCTFPALPNQTTGVALMCVWTNAAPAMIGTNASGTCDGEGLADPGDRLSWTDPPSPAGDDVDVLQMRWDPPGLPYDLECAPRFSTGSVTDVLVVTCTARGRDERFVAGALVDVEATGLNDADGNTPASPDFTCTTGTSGSCSFSHGPVAAGNGTTAYRAWVDADGSNATVEADLAEGWFDEAAAGDEAEPDTTAVVERTWNPARPDLLDCDDETGPATERETLPSLAGAASEVTFTCRITDANGSPYTQDWLVGGEVHQRFPNDPDHPDYWTPDSLDYSCRTGDDGVCEITVTQADDEVGEMVLCFVTEKSPVGCGDDEAGEPHAADGSDEADDTADLVRIAWVADGPVADGIDAEAEADAARVGATQAIDVRVFDQHSAPYSGGTTVKFELFAGSPSDTDGNTPGTPDGSCSTGAASSCTFVYSQPAAAAGDDLVCAWTGRAPALSGTGSSALCESEPLADEGYGGAGDADGWDVPEPADHYDVVKRTWQRSVSVDCDDATVAATEAEVNPATGTGTAEPYSCVVRDQNGAVVAGALVTAEVLGSINDPDSPDAASFGSPDYSCTTDGAGTCTLQATQADSETGTTTICFFAGTAAEGEAACGTEPFDEDAAGGTDVDNDSADAVRLTWEPRSAAGGGVDVEPELVATPLGVQHVVSAVVYDQFGDPFTGNTKVSFEWFPGSPSDWDGLTPATPDRSCTTASYHRCSFAYTQARYAGTDVFCAWTNATPAMGGTAAAPTCDGEAAADADDAGGEFDAPEPGDDVDVFGKRWFLAAARLDCDDSTGPATEEELNPSGGAAGTEVYTCTVTDSSGAVVTANQTIAAEVETPVNDPDAPDADDPHTPDYTCQTGDDGICQIAVTQAEGEVGTTTVCFWTGTGAEGDAACGDNEPFDEGMGAGGGDAAADLADSVRLSWEQRAAAGLDVEPETSVTLLGTQHVIGAVVYDQFGDPFAANTKVSFEWFPGSPSDWDGITPATPDRSCTTAAAARCSIAYTQARLAGTDLFCAWIGASPALSGTASGGTCDGEALADADDDESAHDAAAPVSDHVDLVSKTWAAHPPARLDCDGRTPQTEWDVKPASSGADGNAVYTCTVRDAAGGAVPSGTLVRGEAMVDVNDPDSIDGASFPSTDYSCATTAAGTCNVTVSQSDGEVGTSVVCFYVGSDADGQSLCASESPFDAPTEGGGDEADDLADSVELTWQVRQAGGGSLDVEPETSTSPLGTQHTITAVVYDQFGDPFAGNTKVFFEWFPGSPSDWDGLTPATPDRSCTTVNDSRCSFVYTQGRHPGTDVFCAWTLYEPAMAGTTADVQCGGEGLTDPDDTPGVIDARGQPLDRTDAISKTWTAS